MRTTVLAGGVGGAKLVWGLAQVLAPEELTILGNTGDDLTHLGLTICPDLDTVMYTLAGMADPDSGWGVKGDSFGAMESVARYRGSTWFRLGDQDLGTHLARTELLAAGLTLTQVTAHLCHALGVRQRLLPMADQPAPTLVDTAEGVLSFQEWFVRRRWQPAVRKVILPLPRPAASSQVLEALDMADLILIAPSNPLVSVAPILNVSSVREALESRQRMVVAVSPIIGGRAVKGPAAKMMAQLGMEVSPLGVARWYGAGLLSGLGLDQADESLTPAIEALGIAALPASTWMRTDSDRIGLASCILDWVGSMRPDLNQKGAR
jgi:LPPG:FO 2-phospho-L-lactate transferase